MTLKHSKKTNYSVSAAWLWVLNTAPQPHASQHSGALRPDLDPAERSADRSTYWFSLQVTAAPQERKSKQQWTRRILSFAATRQTIFTNILTLIQLLSENDNDRAVTHFLVKMKMKSSEFTGGDIQGNSKSPRNKCVFQNSEGTQYNNTTLCRLEAIKEAARHNVTLCGFNLRDTFPICVSAHVLWPFQATVRHHTLTQTQWDGVRGSCVHWCILKMARGEKQVGGASRVPALPLPSGVIFFT